MLCWKCFIQYLGLTYHPDGRNTSEIYPLKLNPKRAWFLMSALQRTWTIAWAVMTFPFHHGTLQDVRLCHSGASVSRNEISYS